MNYILHFQPRTAGQPITHDQIKHYFKERHHYTVNDYQSLYNNEDTGVFFTFEYGGQRQLPEGPASDILPVYFNLACGKPHIFALEAETELSGFINNFLVRVSDPAMKGGSYADYDEMDFFRGWTLINEAHYREPGNVSTLSKLPVLPLALMEKIWRWNYHVADMQAELGQSGFVPRVMFIENQSTFSTAVVWTDAQPAVLPRVDMIILYRRQKGQGLGLNKKEDIALIDFSELEPWLKDYLRETEHLEFFNLIYQKAPEPLKKLVRSQKALPADRIRFIPFSQVHDREMIAKILTG